MDSIVLPQQTLDLAEKTRQNIETLFGNAQSSWETLANRGTQQEGYKYAVEWRWVCSGKEYRKIVFGVLLKPDELKTQERNGIVLVEMWKAAKHWKVENDGHAFSPMTEFESERCGHCYHVKGSGPHLVKV